MWPIATLWQLPPKRNCHEDSGPTINKAIIVTRQVGRKHPTTNQRSIKMFELMMKMVIIIPIIIIIGTSIPNTQSRPKDARGNHHKKTRTHTMPQGGGWEPQQADPDPTTPQGGGKEATTTPHHTTGRGRGNHWGGGGGGGAVEPGLYTHIIYMYIYIYMYKYDRIIYTSITTHIWGTRGGQLQLLGNSAFILD